MFQNHLEGKKRGEEQTKQDWPRVDIVEAGGAGMGTLGAVTGFSLLLPESFIMKS